MIGITYIFLAIVVLFAVLVSLRSLFSLKICALCASIFLTWVTLIVLMYLGYEIDPVFVGILMGGSAVGILYKLEQKLPSRYHLFKLPFLLTLIALTYVLLKQSIDTNLSIAIVLLWIGMALLYAGRNTKGLKEFSRKLIECCRNW